jgi:EpsI family protein
MSTIISSEIVKASGAEESFSGVYRKGGREVSLYMGYRSTAFLANENFFHSPTVCLPSSGWKELDISKHTIDAVPGFGTVPTTKMVMQNSELKMLVYFWFQTKDRITHDKNVNRFHLALHAIMRDNTHDLFIRPITPITEGETIAQAEARMDQFVRDMMPVLQQFLKEKQYYEGARF